MEIKMTVSHSCFTCCIVNISLISGLQVEERVQTDLIEIDVEIHNKENGGVK